MKACYFRATGGNQRDIIPDRNVSLSRTDLVGPELRQKGARHSLDTSTHLFPHSWTT